jgi:hypothetical protein
MMSMSSLELSYYIFVVVVGRNTRAADVSLDALMTGIASRTNQIIYTYLTDQSKGKTCTPKIQYRFILQGLLGCKTKLQLF